MPLDVSRIHALIFDVDGTLRDTDDQYVSSISHWLHPIRAVLPARDTHRFARWLVMASETPATLLYGIPDRLEIDQHVARIINFFYRKKWIKANQSFLIIDGVREMLERLHQRYPLSIASARDELNTVAFLENFKLMPFFNAIATAQTCRHIKPYPDQILWAAEQMRVSPKNCLMIGDTTVDIQAGKAAGAQTVGLLCGFGTEDELRASGADVILSLPSHLLHILLQ